MVTVAIEDIARMVSRISDLETRASNVDKVMGQYQVQITELATQLAGNKDEFMKLVSAQQSKFNEQEAAFKELSSRTVKPGDLVDTRTLGKTSLFSRESVRVARLELHVPQLLQCGWYSHWN